ncbi:hypothetical protein PG999_004681 [Apiospora kogelbergensis]|uniref:Yippee domain-containing protein n=1 Tax=Apiospora kogelbergensis TaxID=1337665 RepID=A0AAW0QZZ3_9PEZI
MADGTPIPAGLPPRYASYLLPSFSLPFKRRQVSPVNPCFSTPPAENAVPPLSSSPTESTLSSSVGSSSVSSYAPSRPSFASSSDDYVPSVEVQAQSLPGNSRLLKVYPDTIRCSTCSTDLAFASQIVSKGFTGSHDVADITCNICHAKVGWKYVDAKEDAQKYKVGKYILETNRTVDFKHWDDDTTSLGVPEFPATATTQKPKKTMDAEPIVFDSEDEDECDDIFSGTWDPAVVAKRRAHKAPRPSRRGL